MGAFGSCLGVGRPVTGSGSDPRFLSRHDARGLKALFNIDLRVGANAGMKLNVSRHLAKHNSYLSDARAQRLSRFKPSTLSFTKAKNGVKQRFFKNSSNKSSQQHPAPTNLGAPLQNSAANGLSPKLVDIDDNPLSPFDKPSVPGHESAKLLFKNQANFNGSFLSTTNTANNSQDLSQPGTSEAGKILIALFDYAPRTLEDLAICKGDHLEAQALDTNGLWWLARSKTTKKTGFVPSSYVAELKTLGAEPWYFGKIGRLGAETHLKSPGNDDGAFIIRDAESNNNRYSLSLLHKNQIKHYKIRQFEEGGFYLTKKTIFSTLHDFVSHYSTHADGLCIELRAPCIISSDLKPTPQGLSHDTCDKWETDRNSLKLLRELGHGQFGQVYEGLWLRETFTTPVAIKTLKRGSMDPQEFMKEAQIMKTLYHENLVQLYAVCTREEPIYIVTELMTNGCLLNYLQKNKHLEVRTLIYMACQIADGMAYLEDNNYLHRDLAARNILVGEKNKVKIADFGLARLIKETEYEAQPYSKCPIKWTSPESITYNRYTSKSDVWSFGIVLYEIITYGNTPYPGMSNNEMLQRVEKLNYRMPIGIMPNCPQKLYMIMTRCWHQDPNQRPAFKTLRKELDNLFT